MSEPTKTELTSALKVLLFIHNSKPDLFMFKNEIGCHTTDQAKGAIADCFRYVSTMKDRAPDNEGKEE